MPFGVVGQPVDQRRDGDRVAEALSPGAEGDVARDDQERGSRHDLMRAKERDAAPGFEGM
jgi:hypothetical protein